MRKKMMIVLMVVAFAGSSLLLMTSCAKKAVKGEAGIAAPAKKPEAAAKMGDDDAYRKAEAERQARLRELERQQLVQKRIRVFEADNIYFDFDRSELLPQAQKTLKVKAKFLKDYPDYFVRIEGNCDERGTIEYNLALGERRAHAAKKFLMALGIDGKRLRTISYGEEKPADPRSNEVAWAQNRRDEFKLLR